MFIYLAMSESAVSGALVREDRGIQKHVQYVSMSLLSIETRFQRMVSTLCHLEKAEALLPIFSNHRAKGVPSEKYYGESTG